MTPGQHRTAKHVLAWLVSTEPGREHAKTDGWEIAVERRIKAERWPEVCAAVEANPDLSAKTIAERLQPPAATSAPTPSAPQPEPWTGPEPDTTAGPVLTRTATSERVARIKAALESVTKPPIPAESENA